MKISVIIPALNEEDTIEQTLTRVLALEGDYEVVVVDGGSQDNTAAIAGRLASVIGAPRGRANQMNAGARAAKGEVLLFLHADSQLPEKALACVEGCLNDRGTIGGRFRVRLDRPEWIYRLIGFSINCRDRILKGFTGDQAIFIRKDAFESLGGFGEMPLMEDLDLGKRMLRKGRVARLSLPVVTSARRWQENGVVRTIVLMWTLRLLYNLGCPPSKLKRFYGDTR